MESADPNAALLHEPANVDSVSDETAPVVCLTTKGSSFASKRGRLIAIFRSVFWDNYITLMLTAAIGAAIAVTCIKLLSKHTSVFQIVLVRASFSTATLWGLCLWNGVSLWNPRDVLPLVMLRGVVGTCGFVMTTLCIFLLPLSDASFMTNSTPVFTAALSWTFGMESLGPMSWAGVVGCLIGNAMIARPPFLSGDDDSEWDARRVFGVIFAFLSNVFVASSSILYRYIGKSVNPMVLIVHMHIITVLAAIPFLAAGVPMPVSSRHSWPELVYYAVVSLFGVCMQTIQARGFQIGPPTKTTSLFMMNMLISGLISVIALSEKLSSLSIGGAAVILISVILVTLQRDSKPTDTTDHDPPLLREREPELEHAEGIHDH